MRYQDGRKFEIGKTLKKAVKMLGGSLVVVNAALVALPTDEMELTTQGLMGVGLPVLLAVLRVLGDAGKHGGLGHNIQQASKGFDSALERVLPVMALMLVPVAMAVSATGCNAGSAREFFETVDRLIEYYDEVSIRYDDILQRIEQSVEAYERAQVSGDDARIEQARKRWQALVEEAQPVYDEALRVYGELRRQGVSAVEPEPVHE